MVIVKTTVDINWFYQQMPILSHFLPHKNVEMAGFYKNQLYF